MAQPSSPLIPADSDLIPPQVDADVTRNRGGRFALAAGTAFATYAIPIYIGAQISDGLFENSLMGISLGILIGGFVASEFAHYFMIDVRAVRGFMTVDNFRSLLGLEDTNVSYGQGTHFSYPWESREEINNISLDEVSEDFTLVVQGTTGAIYVAGSIRLRADLKALPIYRAGVAAVVNELVDIIKVQVLAFLATKTVDEAQKSVAELNTKLKNEFVNGPARTKFEQRFGVRAGDITIASIMPSEEAQKTRNAIDEAMNAFKGMAALRNQTPEQLRADIESGKFSQADQDRLRRDFMAMSDNAKLETAATDITIRIDANPDVAEAIKTAGPGLAGLAALFAAKQGHGSKQSKGKT